MSSNLYQTSTLQDIIVTLILCGYFEEELKRLFFVLNLAMETDYHDSNTTKIVASEKTSDGRVAAVS